MDMVYKLYLNKTVTKKGGRGCKYRNDLKNCRKLLKDVRKHSISSFQAPFISKNVKLRLRGLNYLPYIDSKT